MRRRCFVGRQHVDEHCHGSCTASRPLLFPALGQTEPSQLIQAACQSSVGQLHCGTGTRGGVSVPTTPLIFVLQRSGLAQYVQVIHLPVARRGMRHMGTHGNGEVQGWVVGRPLAPALSYGQKRACTWTAFGRLCSSAIPPQMMRGKSLCTHHHHYSAPPARESGCGNAKVPSSNSLPADSGITQGWSWLGLQATQGRCACACLSCPRVAQQGAAQRTLDSRPRKRRNKEIGVRPAAEHLHLVLLYSVVSAELCVHIPSYAANPLCLPRPSLSLGAGLPCSMFQVYTFQHARYADHLRSIC